MFEVILVLVKAAFVLFIALNLASAGVWVERKGSALIQDRIGANRAGAYFYAKNPLLNLLLFPVRIMGVLGVINTLVCDSVKGLLKEDFLPEGTSNFIHSLAPFMAACPVMVAFAMVPLAPDFELFGHVIRLQVAEINVGILFFLAMGGLGVYGVVIAGWCSNNKYSLLGALRASAQMISYELAMGVTVATMICFYGSVDLYSMVQAQEGRWLGFIPAWGVIGQPLSFILLFVAGVAETKRMPFDLPESESELVAGYFTEYSGMKFLLFWLGEFTEIALLSAVMSLMFFGGWNLPYVTLPDGWVGALLGHIVLMTKILFFVVLQIVIRWTLPRFRFDQVMSLGWKILLPVSMVNLMVTALFKVM